jgi:hypothetical protein
MKLWIPTIVFGREPTRILARTSGAPSKVFCGFCQWLSANTDIALQDRPLSFYVTSFPINHLLFLRSFEAKYFEIAPKWATASLLKLHDRTQKHHTLSDSSGRVISPTQVTLPVNTHYPREKDIHTPNGIRTPNPSAQTAIGLACNVFKFTKINK